MTNSLEIIDDKILDAHACQSKIPKFIYQTFETRRVPERMFSASRSWVLKNPEYSYKFFDFLDRISFIERFDCTPFCFDSNDLIAAYNKILPGAGKADLFRYLLIYTYGGVYMDIDTWCKVPLSTYVNDDVDLVSGVGERGDLHQWGLIYSKNNIILKRTAERVVRNIIDEIFEKGFEGSMEGVTGPPCLHSAFKDLIGDRIAIVNQPGDHTIPLSNVDIKVRLLSGDYFGNRVGFKYQGYESDLKSLGFQPWGDQPIFA